MTSIVRRGYLQKVGQRDIERKVGGVQCVVETMSTPRLDPPMDPGLHGQSLRTLRQDRN